MTTAAPLVSIIVPVRDGEPFISGTLDSALAQTYPQIEVIVVDDGSRDGTRALVEARAARDPRLRLIVQSNKGVAAARNRAIADARGEFIAPLDADDLWEPTKLERQVARMLEGGDRVGLVYCWWMWIDSAGAVLDRSPGWDVEGDEADALLQVNYTGNASVPLFRRSFLEAAGGYDESLRARGAQGCEDWDAAVKVAERSEVAVAPSILVGYRRRSDSLSTRRGTMWRSYLLMMESVRQRRPDLSAAVDRRSRGQFAMYLAGVSFWSGAYLDAVAWSARAVGSGVAFEVLPHVTRVLPKALQPDGGRRSRRIVQPGMPFAGWDLPAPLIPYDRIYARRFTR